MIDVFFAIFKNRDRGPKFKNAKGPEIAKDGPT